MRAERYRWRPNAVGDLLLVRRQRGPGDRYQPSNHSASGNAVGIVFVSCSRPAVAVAVFVRICARLCVFFVFVPEEYHVSVRRIRSDSYRRDTVNVGVFRNCFSFFFLLLRLFRVVVDPSVVCARRLLVVKESTNIYP